MAQKMAKSFIIMALFFFIIGCAEGIMFPSMFTFRNAYAVYLNVPPEQLKPFFDHFLTKIHTHITLIGWVSSSLMGIIYLIAPQISNTERYNRWIAYSNLVFHVSGVLLMTIGFHLIGIHGLTPGHTYGTPQFREVVEPFKLLVFLGGSLITLSGFCFAYNIVRTLFSRKG